MRCIACRCEAITTTGFIQHLAAACLAHGYRFYVAGEIPPGKAPCQVDANLLALYDVPLPRWARYRRTAHGLANGRYLRHRRLFLLLATHGRFTDAWFHDTSQHLSFEPCAPVEVAR